MNTYRVQFRIKNHQGWSQLCFKAYDFESAETKLTKFYADRGHTIQIINIDRVI